jgi:hypothetical protein
MTETDIFPGGRICDDELENNLLKLAKLTLEGDYEFTT